MLAASIDFPIAEILNADCQLVQGKPWAAGIKIECEYAMLMEIRCRRNDTSVSPPAQHASQDA